MSNSSMNKFHGSSMFWRPLIQSPTRSSVLVSFIFLSLLVFVFLSSRLLHSPALVGGPMELTILTQTIGSRRTGSYTNPGNTTTQVNEKVGGDKNSQHIATENTNKTPKKFEFPLSCSTDTQTCPSNYPKTLELDPDASPSPTCPDYFRWIYEDLRPWIKTGITQDMVERAKRTANFKLVVVNGKAYVERYKTSWQTRDVFTLWGIVQLLRKYPGRVPDLEFMFDCVDWPVLQSHYFQGPNAEAPPPLFRYCGDDNTLDIVFPDWSFWGWAEINIRPWEILSKELKEGNKKVSWPEREPYAYWKGNPFVAPTRMDLLNCNISDKQDWRARIFVQNWVKEAQEGFKQSDLASQCIHRYKIYIEGSAWSVSEKYILACDSVPLIVKPHYYDFFSRGLMPTQHYWPIKENDKCKSIKHAVEWGDTHMQEAEAIGKASSDLVHNGLKMDYVYDYMLHLLNEYAKLLKYKPTIPPNAVELCAETLACPTDSVKKSMEDSVENTPSYRAPTDSIKKFMEQSLVKTPSYKAPCSMPPPYGRVELQNLLKRRTNAERRVEKWEKDYWANHTMQQ